MISLLVELSWCTEDSVMKGIDLLDSKRRVFLCQVDAAPSVWALETPTGHRQNVFLHCLLADLPGGAQEMPPYGTVAKLV